MKLHQIDAAMAPALGDIRESKAGDWIYVHQDAATRKDWPRYWEAIGVAFILGARVVPLADGS